MPYGTRTRSGRYTRSGNRYNSRSSSRVVRARGGRRAPVVRARRGLRPGVRMGRMRGRRGRTL